MGRLSHGHKPVAIIQCAPNRQCELAWFNVVVHGVFSIDERLMAFDGLPADQRNRSGKCRFIRAETVPTETLWRPHEPRARAARQIISDIEVSAFCRFSSAIATGLVAVLA